MFNILIIYNGNMETVALPDYKTAEAAISNISTKLNGCTVVRLYPN